MVQNVVVIAVVNHQYTARFEQVVKVGDGSQLVGLVAIIVWQVRKRVPHADDGVKAPLRHFPCQVPLKGQPVGLEYFCRKKSIKLHLESYSIHGSTILDDLSSHGVKALLTPSIEAFLVPSLPSGFVRSL